MKQILIFSLLLTTVFYILPVAAESTIRPKPEDLDGRELVVRIYKDWRLKPYKFSRTSVPLDEPEVFRKVSVRLQGRTVPYSSIESMLGQINETSVVVIIAEDQKDEAIGKALGDSIYAVPYEKGCSFYLPYLTIAAEKWWTFKDAIGNPIPQATVQIFLPDCDNPTKAGIRAVQADDQGRLKMPNMTGRLRELYLIVSHPHYGTAILGPDQCAGGGVILLPLVKAGTEADTLSIWGNVLDTDGDPVAGTLIRCSSVYTPGGGRINGLAYWPYTVLTDDQGRFAMNLPIKKTIKANGIPPNSKYAVSVEPPRALKLLGFSGKVPNGRESAIVLERGHFRTFVFEDANGSISDIQKLEMISVCIWRSDGSPHYIRYPDWKDGKILPLGRLEAGMNSNINIKPLEFERYEFEPIQVTAESPEKLIFKIKQKPRQQDILYSGQVVHGITGEPMPGAFIIIPGSTKGDFAAITPEQWQQLHELDTVPSPDDPALEPIQQIRPFRRILRTDINGSFQFSVKSLELFHILVAFEENYLPVQYDLSRKDMFKPHENNFLRLPTIRLYPAAKVILEPCVDDLFDEIRISLRYGNNSHLDWIEGFFAFRESLAVPFVRNEGLRPPYMLEIMQIPAGMNIKLVLQAIHSGRNGTRWGCPIFTEIINAGQGQTVDLGRITIQPEMPVYVKVVESAGNPLEGVAVAHGEADGKKWFGQKHITDANGMAKFYTPPYYKAAFFVGWRGRNTKTPWQSLIYQTTGPQDANSVYTFQLSDEVFHHIFK